ncbi:hypothetical protein B0H13DRAFT_1903518 [Mycena leptocephala]|nr:hypothetical protein B0H13DRAFT_1903518 [Mycena leptocephala]
MQYTVDSAQFDGDWDGMMKSYCKWGPLSDKWLGFSPALRAEPGDHKRLHFLYKQLYRCYVIWGFHKKIVIVPALLILSTFIMGVVAPTVTNSAVNDVKQITLGLAAVTNLVLTALTGESTRTAGRILYIRRAASHVGLDRTLQNRYSAAIGIILESGAIYCITAIFLVITVSVYDSGIHNIGIGVAEQLINIIPTFTLVYVGLNNTDYSQHNHQVLSTTLSPAQP